MPSYQKTEEKIVVSFSGNLDTLTCINFENDLFEELRENENNVVFDLKEVDSISSMFLRVCTKVAQKAGKDKFSIINVPESAMKVFKLTKFDSFLDIS